MNHYADALIATRSILSDEQIDHVAHQAQSVLGIKQLTRSKRIPRFIWVTYRSGRVRARSILNQFNQPGFNASLVDM